MREKIKSYTKKFINELSVLDLVYAFLGGLVLAFVIRNVHSVSPVTEGGMLGLGLLIDHWLNISPSITTPIFNIICYLFAFKILGKKFIVNSIFAVAGFSGCLAIFELFPPILPGIGDIPWLASILGGLGVGLSCGLCIISTSAPTSDDAIVLALNKKLKVKITWVYLASDLVVLGASLSYIPWQLIMWSLLTVIISGQVIGIMQKLFDKITTFEDKNLNNKICEK